MPILIIHMVCCLILFAQHAGAAQNIGALGRIAPSKGITLLSGPPGDTIETIHVAPGQKVEKNALLVSFASYKKRQNEIDLATKKVRHLDLQTAKSIEIQTSLIEIIRQQADQHIVLKQSELNSARANFEFAQKNLDRLLKAGSQSYSAQTREAREHELEIAQINLTVSQKQLQNLKTGKALDLKKARLELSRLKLARTIQMEQARQDLESAQKNLKSATLYSPSQGMIIDVLQKQGEKCSGGPMIRIADLDAMAVIAEVFQADLLKIKQGMKAKITSKSLPAPLTGLVTRIGRVIIDPSKIAQVNILLDDPDLASRLINLEVEVSILMD